MSDAKPSPRRFAAARAALVVLVCSGSAAAAFLLAPQAPAKPNGTPWGAMGTSVVTVARGADAAWSH
jgi:hypothetical protein